MREAGSPWKVSVAVDPEAYRRDQRAADRQQDRRRADASHLRLQGGSDSPGAAGGPAGSGKRGVAGEIIPGWGQTEDFIAPWFATLEAKNK